MPSPRLPPPVPMLAEERPSYSAVRLRGNTWTGKGVKVESMTRRKHLTGSNIQFVVWYERPSPVFFCFSADVMCSNSMIYLKNGIFFLFSLVHELHSSRTCRHLVMLINGFREKTMKQQPPGEE